ncbi:hypothetical protein BKA69DRAFT_1080611 [Paraphysoderma sedebokerense]|nr:hypothetical protein BKA69DRAFT_1080611 [Paraphysoderma sedebokerense]
MLMWPVQVRFPGELSQCFEIITLHSTLKFAFRPAIDLLRLLVIVSPIADEYIRANDIKGKLGIGNGKEAEPNAMIYFRLCANMFAREAGKNIMMEKRTQVRIFITALCSCGISLIFFPRHYP